MRSWEIFDIVLERVRECQALTGRIPAIRPDASANGGPSKVGNQLAEYVADFALAGKSALRSRRQLEIFQAFYVENTPYRQACELLKVKPGLLDFHCHQIKRAVGKKLRARGLFPFRLYKERYHDSTDGTESVSASRS